jgi:hypothetical protein
VSKAYSTAQAEQLAEGTSTRVQGADAQALRALWNDWRVDFEAGTAPGSCIRVLGPAGEPLQLYVRDAITLEDSRGLITLP